MRRRCQVAEGLLSETGRHCVVGKFAEHLTPGLGIVDRGEPAVDAVVDELGQGPDPGGQHRNSGREGLENHTRLRLVPA